MEESEAFASLQRQVVEMAELLGGLAHELRNPLSTMMIHMKLLTEDLEDRDANIEDVRRRALQKVRLLHNEAQRLRTLFDEVLNLTGTVTLEKEPVDLRKVVAELAEFVTPMATSQQIEVVVHSPPDALVCPVDQNLLRQALLNLMVNAQQAMPDGGTLTIEAAADDNAARLSVSDTGIGMTENDLQRIMRPFFSTKKEGNGLGLSITQRIVEEHGGRLDMQSRLGEGTTATIALPLTDGESA